MRTRYLDPDLRPRPQTDLFCCVCSRDLRPDSALRYVLTLHDGFEAVHPDNLTEGLAAGAVLRPIGSDCARRLGLEWTLTRDTLGPDNA